MNKTVELKLREGAWVMGRNGLVHPLTVSLHAYPAPEGNVTLEFDSVRAHPVNGGCSMAKQDFTELAVEWLTQLGYVVSQLFVPITEGILDRVFFNCGAGQGVLIVAVGDKMGQWSAYLSIVSAATNTDIAEQYAANAGIKLRRAEAVGLFTDFNPDLYRR